MFGLSVDPAANAVTIAYGDRVLADETRRCAEELERALPLLHDGFRLVVDLTELRSMEISCRPFIARIMEICNEAGVAEVLRIIPDPTRDIGLQIMSFFHYRNDVYIRTCTSAAEAAALLEEQAA